MNKNNIALGLSVLAILLVIMAGGEKTVVERVVEKTVGAQPGTEQFERNYFRAGLTEGGRVATTTTASTYTTAIADFPRSLTYYDWTPNVNTTVSISATSTRNLIPNVGDVATVYFRNASTTATATVTFAAVDAGVDIQYTEATGGDLVLNGLDWAKLTLIREAGDLVTVIFSEFTEAD